MEITREKAAKAAESFKVSEQNRDVWMAGFAAGFIKGKVNAYAVVAKSCLELSEEYEIPQNNAKAEE